MNTIADVPLVAILRGITPGEILAHLAALETAGFSRAEIPLNSPQWPDSLAQAIRYAGSRMAIGAGTVTRPELVDQVAQIGCRFILTPNTDPAVIQQACASKMTSVIGCLTPSEAFSALHYGASALKIFPAGEMGPEYISALRAVLPSGTRLWATGGITPDNLPVFLAAGCCGAGLGSDLYRAGQSPDETLHNAQRFIRAWQASSDLAAHG